MLQVWATTVNTLQQKSLTQIHGSKFVEVNWLDRD